MPYFKKIVGERCYLSPIDPADAPAFTAWLNDAEVAAGVTFTRRVVNVEQERDGLARLAAKPYNFVIVALDGDELLGSCGIGDVSAVDRTGELGIMIGNKEFWNRGFGTEAVRLLLRFGFLTLNLNNISLTVHSFNERAIRCYEKCGFKRCGYWPDSWYHDGTLHGHRPDVSAARRLRRGIAGAQKGLASHCIHVGCNMDTVAPYRDSIWRL